MVVSTGQAIALTILGVCSILAPVPFTPMLATKAHEITTKYFSRANQVVNATLNDNMVVCHDTIFIQNDDRGQRTGPNCSDVYDDAVRNEVAPFGRYIPDAYPMSVYWSNASYDDHGRHLSLKCETNYFLNDTEMKNFDINKVRQLTWRCPGAVQHCCDDGCCWGPQHTNEVVLLYIFIGIILTCMAISSLCVLTSCFGQLERVRPCFTWITGLLNSVKEFFINCWTCIRAFCHNFSFRNCWTRIASVNIRNLWRRPAEEEEILSDDDSDIILVV